MYFFSFLVWFKGVQDFHGLPPKVYLDICEKVNDKTWLDYAWRKEDDANIPADAIFSSFPTGYRHADLVHYLWNHENIESILKSYGTCMFICLSYLR